MPRLEQEYIDTGKVRYIYRPSFSVEHVPLRVAAEALYCAGDQGAFWEMHDWQYANAERLVGAYESVTGTLDLLIGQSAPDLGLNGAGLATCLESEKYRSLVEGMVQDAANRGLTSTPTFLINTQLKVGATYEDLRALIEEELAK